MLLSEIPKLPTDPPVRGFPGVWKLFPFHNSLPGTGLCPSLFCLSFYFLYFVLPPFKDNGLSLWVPGVLHQCSEVVLWNFLSIQMIFRWICRGESGLSVLFLHHFRTVLRSWVLFSSLNLNKNPSTNTFDSFLKSICFFSMVDILDYQFKYLSVLVCSLQEARDLIFVIPRYVHNP